jgi:transposase
MMPSVKCKAGLFRSVGARRTEAAKIGGVGLQMMRFNARGAAGLLDGKSPGQPSKLNDVQRQAIMQMIESGPIPAIHGVVRWRLIDLSQWIYEEFRITVAKQTLSRGFAPGLPQALSPTPPSCAGRGSNRGF